MTDQAPAIDQLLNNLDHAMLADRHRLRRQLLELRKKPDEEKLAQWVARMQASCAQVTARRASLPVIRYDDSLPIAAKRDEIKEALNKHQVRFEDQSDSNTLIKLMTDGILLAETQNDRYLERYDTIIVDEAHERSLNIDFLLGYLKQLLRKRPDLKLIVTSATIDTERFAQHFDNAPIVEVSGRTFPVDTWYRPLTLEQDEEGNRVEDDLTVDQAILATLDEIAAYERSERRSPGDVLVFLPGEREIRDAAEMLRKAQLKHTEILPLYARLSPAEQQRIFQSHPGRRIVLATNVAETSLTLPRQGAASADRADLAGQRQPAQRSLRPGRARHLRALVQRRGFYRASGVYRSRNPAHQPRRSDPADAAPAPRRDHRFPVYRTAGRQGHQRRLQPAARAVGGGPQQPAHATGSPIGTPAGGPAHGPHAAGSRQARQLAGSTDRRQRHVDPGPARASAGTPASRGSGSRTVERSGFGLCRVGQSMARL
ncbi:ATP-dependent RNA helicase HrpA [Ditylenchus destructor]|nr:ATP-dependent RNA helicase HrpA [Ditylenchus destructor]